MRRLAAGFLSELVVALVDNAAVLVVGVPNLGAVPAAALCALNLGGENADATVAFLALIPSADFCLYQFKICGSMIASWLSST